MNRSGTIGFAALALIPWAIGGLLTAESARGLTGHRVAWSLAAEALTSVGAVIVLAAVVRRWPIGVAWTGIGLALVTAVTAATAPEYPIWPAGASWLFVLVAGVAAARAESVVDGAVVAAAAVLAVLSIAPSARQDPTLWGVALLAAGTTAVSISFGHRHRAAERRLVTARAEASVTERRAMARELHDVIAHEVTGIVVLAQAGIAAGDDRSGVLARIERSGARALTDIRAMVDTLRDPDVVAPPRAPSASGAAGLRATLEPLASATVLVHVAPEADGEDLPDLVRLVAHRVVSEGVTNARRHAAGSVVRVTVERADGDLLVDVVDDGPVAGAPPGPGPGGGTGLIGLTERAATVGGTVTAGPEENGWRLAARLPVRQD
ncbi:sensor histidine kinase [Tsukamurella pseudospumae]|uniref:histidine kinase n=1 Tax=Tsukamurella pseudospumae TaxID=239498 RepID=A0A137ZS00_9ACTN|nr:histidine kinase [Tsukamurella pseudospumae]KXP00945.1 hypothetical protein AXK61_13170 [Tsukamurella pseudospumae]